MSLSVCTKCQNFNGIDNYNGRQTSLVILTNSASHKISALTRKNYELNKLIYDKIAHVLTH